MKNLAVVALCVAFVAVVWARPNGEKYSDQYDNVNVDEILQNDRLRTNYFTCLRTGKKCTKEGQRLREILPDALKSGCSKCTEVQKSKSEHVLRIMAEKYPKEFLEFEKLYDPDGEYRKKYAGTLREKGVILPERITAS